MFAARQDLRGKIAEASGAQERWLWGRDRAVALSSFARETYLHDVDPSGRKALLLCDDQLNAATGLIELDGVADSILVCPPDLKHDHLLAVARAAGIDIVAGTSPALEKARDHHQHTTEALERERAALDKRVEAEEERWQKEKDRLRGAIDRARSS